MKPPILSDEERPITICPTMPAHGYHDQGTYEAIPFVGHFWGEEFMPTDSKKSAATAEAQARYLKKWQRENAEKHAAYQREYYRRKRGGQKQKNREYKKPYWEET